jgi:DNA-binding transcriptional LysR family regulator
MELRHLRYFAAVADSGGISRAAAKLHVAQSAISRQIQDLEEEIGVGLLSRDSRKVGLTNAGKDFLVEARKVLAAAETAVETARRSARGETGTLRIGSFMNGVGAFFPPLVRAFRTRHPGVKLSLFELLAREQIEALATNVIDIAFTRQPQGEYVKLLNTELLFREPIRVVLPRKHPLAGPCVMLSDLAEESFVLMERDAAPRFFDSIIALCSQAGFFPRIATLSSNWQALLTHVESGEGIGLVSAGVRRFKTDDLAFCDLKPTTSVELVVAWRKADDSPILRSFLELIRERKESIRRQVSNG